MEVQISSPIGSMPSSQVLAKRWKSNHCVLFLFDFISVTSYIFLFIDIISFQLDHQPHPWGRPELHSSTQFKLLADGQNLINYCCMTKWMNDEGGSIVTKWNLRIVNEADTGDPKVRKGARMTLVLLGQILLTQGHVSTCLCRTKHCNFQSAI